MAQTLQGRIKYDLNSVLTGFVLFFTFQTMRMAAPMRKTNEAPAAVTLSSDRATGGYCVTSAG